MIRPSLPFLLAAALAAQEPSTLGVQIRASSPSENLKDAVDGKAGLGLSLGVESDYEDGWKGRLVLGYDAWGPGNTAGQSGIRGKANVAHLGVEAVRMLGPEGAKGFTGPFVLLGVGAYGWNVTFADPAYDVAVTRRVIHVGGSFGLGYRFSPNVDVELRVTAGRVDPQLMAGFLALGLTYRF